MKEREKKLNPFTDLNPIEYRGLLIAVNLNYQEELRESLPPFLGEKLSGICLILPGSDGKKERHCQSKTEIIVLGSVEYLLQKTRDILGSSTNQHSLSEGNIYAGLPEIKLLSDGSNNYLSYTYGNPKSVYPDRILHSAFLLGDEELYRRAKLEVLEELKKPEIGKEMKHQLKSYRKAIETGFYRDQRIFDTEKGVQYYEENDDPKLLRLGFKQAFLRTVQRKLDLLTRRGLLSDQDLANEIKNRYLSGLSNTLVRIKFLSALGLIPQEMVMPLIEAYYWFLQRYHEAQEQYKNTREQVELPFDRKLFDKHRETVLDFLHL